MFQKTPINPISPVSGKNAWTVAREVANSTAELLLEWWPKLKEISDKGQNDIVTNVDKAAETLIKSELTKHFPEHHLEAFWHIPFFYHVLIYSQSMQTRHQRI